jgi:hypothetical protein
MIAHTEREKRRPGNRTKNVAIVEARDLSESCRTIYRVEGNMQTHQHQNDQRERNGVLSSSYGCKQTKNTIVEKSEHTCQDRDENKEDVNIQKKIRITKRICHKEPNQGS